MLHVQFCRNCTYVLCNHLQSCFAAKGLRCSAALVLYHKYTNEKATLQLTTVGRVLIYIFQWHTSIYLIAMIKAKKQKKKNKIYKLYDSEIVKICLNV